MKKKWVSFLCLLLLCLFVVHPAYGVASTPWLIDNADYLTDSEETVLLSKLEEISTRQGMDVVIVTRPALYGGEITTFADDFYDESGYRSDGILLLIADYEGEWAISTAGYGITAFTDAGQAYMTEQFVGALSKREFAAAFNTYADLCDAFITQAKAGEPYDVGTLPKGEFRLVRNLLICVGIGLLVSLITTGSMKSKLKTVRAQTAASQYVKAGSMNITECREIFLYHQLQRRLREEKETGGSSTHTSSSGVTHGGSSGKF